MKRTLKIIMPLAFILLIGCNKGDGTVIVKLTDKPLSLDSKTIEAINVTITEISVKKKDADDGGFKPIQSEPRQVNLIEFMDGATTEMGEADLEAGDYNEIRVVVATDNTIKFSDDETLYSLKIPSGSQSGIKIKTSFTVEEDKETEIVIDFDAEQSVSAGGSNDYRLQPVIKVKSVK